MYCPCTSSSLHKDTNWRRCGRYVVDVFIRTWGFPQCFGTIDGSHTSIQAPKDDPLECYIRKEHHSFVLQVLVNQTSTSFTPFTQTTYIRIRIRFLIRFCSHDHITESQFSDAAAIFHVTRVRNATTMVFLNSSSCYSFLSGCEEDDNWGFRVKRRISSCDHISPRESRTAAIFWNTKFLFLYAPPNWDWILSSPQMFNNAAISASFQCCPWFAILPIPIENVW